MAPVLAQSDTEPSPIPVESQSEAPAPESSVQLPGTEAVMQGHADAVREEEERKEELASPALVQEREASRHAYSDLNDAEAEALLNSTFSSVLEQLNSEPSRYMSDARLDRPLGEGDAVVTSEGKTALMEGSIPVEAENDEGKLSKVDLSLEKTQEGFVPVNPLVEVNIGKNAEEGIEVGSGGLTVTQAGAEEGSVGEPFGDKNVFFGEVEEGSDTDLLVSPISAGVEMSDMLRSADSPETLRFPIETPVASELRPVAGGGVEVVSDEGAPLAMVRKPTAVDAQGTAVPVGVKIDGHSVVLQVEHRSGDFAYPILVDPTVENLYQDWGWWYSGQHTAGLSAWSWGQTAGASWINHGYSDTSWPSWNGLFIATAPASMSESWGQWSYSAPNANTYLANATINPFYRNNRTCSAPTPYPQPWDYDGMWNETSWNRLLTNQANQQGWSNLESWGRALIIGVGTSGTYIPCWRDIGIGGVGIWLEDWDYPYINSATGAPTGWIRKDNTARTINVSATDGGLGVRTVRLIAPGGKESNWSKPLCAGTYENRCPNAESGVVTYELSQFPLEGEITMGLVVEDPTKKTWSEQFPIKTDGTPPNVTLSGQLASITAETGEKEKAQSEGKDKLSMPVYNLKISAEDGSSSSPRSGVKELKLLMDGNPLATDPGSCSSESCASTLEWNYPVVLTGLTEGTHTLEIGASDFVGNEVEPSKRKIEFQYIPATGMKEDYVLQHFALPDGHNYAEEPEYRGPEIAVNVTNGNVVFHERDFKVQAERGSLELERVYNSQQPTEKDTQWGHGWTLAQTPELKPQGSESASTATMVRTGEITNPVKLPESQTQPAFNQKLHAEIDKVAGGGYEVDYETTPEVSVFAASGKIQETRLEEGAASSGGGSPAQPEPVTPVYSSAFGSSGTGNGQFAHPGDVAIDAKGNLWVADENNNRLQEFNSKGEFLKTLGSAGAGNGQFSTPKSVAIDAKGNIWVADSGHSRLEEFNEKGEFLKVAGSAGTGNGQFSGPESIAIDAKGNIWVADTYNYRIQELNEKGEFVKVVNPSGLGAIEPTGLDVGPHGNVWVADWAHNRGVELSEEGALVRQFGSEGTGNGQFKRPDAVTVDSRGNVWVTDQLNSRVQEFNQSGEYLAQFGSAGTGSGQFTFSYPTGIAADSKGNLWITDTNNNRIQKWTVPGYAPNYMSSIGSSGTGNGQFAHPGGVAVDAEGNLWVVDENNRRVEEFNSKGEYVTKFGSAGTGNGQFSRPTAIAISPQGNLWVADAGNCRLEEFNLKGEYLAKTGSCGTGNGQFGEAEGIAIDPKGNIWVADTYRARIQELNEKGEFIRAFGSAGSGNGQLCEPTSIAVGPGGNVWTTEWCNNRISEFNESGEFIRKVGTSGAGNGQFSHPDAVAVDSRGNVWVGDESNQRVQEFNQSGEYITQFGSAGTGSGQFIFGYPTGIAADSKGHLWVSDTGNNRIQKFSATDSIGGEASPYYAPPAVKYSYSSGNLTKMALEDEASKTNPSMSVSVNSGLATSVNAEAAGTATLAYEGTKLTSEKDLEGETKYEYEAGNRLKNVTLPNETWASITYDSYARATAVTVHAVGGVSKITHFSYGAESRETIVWGGGNPEIIYNIGEDGSVFKWSYAEVPPTIISISGSLWGNRNSTTAVENKDQTLYVHAESAREIASIKVIENGSAVLAEKICEDKSEPPKHNCDQPEPLEWITNPSEHVGGELDLEVVATDFHGNSTAEKFFVTMPQLPPPNPAEPAAPNFDSVKLFREENGLDRDHPLSEPEINTLILELLYELELGEPAAVASDDGWGIPMRAPELNEMRYRREYVDRAAQVIPQWAEEHAPTTYGGFYVDNRAGGVIYVGFTENQHALVESLKGSPSLINPSQIHEYPVPPTRSVLSLEATEGPIADALAGNPALAPKISAVHLSSQGNTIEVGATEPVSVREFLVAQFGAAAPIVVRQEPLPINLESRYGTSGPIVGGAGLFNNGICTAGYGARAQTGESRGTAEFTYFALTAGHCFEVGDVVHREERKFASGPKLGFVRRDGYRPSEYLATDGAGIVIDENIRSHSVLNGRPLTAQSIQGIEGPKLNSEVCWSGIFGDRQCGTVLFHTPTYVGGHKRYVYVASGPSIEGDSGGPVWDPETHKAVGLISVGWPSEEVPCHETWYEARWCPGMGFTPLLPRGGSAGITSFLGVTILKEG